MKDRMLQDKRVFDLVMSEHDFQIRKWGIQDRSPFEWLAYTTEELGEMAEAISNYAYDSKSNSNASHVVHEAIQTATLCLKIAEMFLNHALPDEEGEKA